LLILIMQALIFGILAMSLDVLLGFTGLASLGQAAYLGIGAYLTAILATRYNLGLGWDFILVLVLGIVAAGLTAALFGLIAIRATGVYFLIITLALGMCVWGLAYRWNSLTGGDNGLNVLFRPVVGIDLSDDLTFFYLVWALFVFTLVMLYILAQSPFGRSLVGIRESESRMRMLGYHTWLHKYVAFVIAGAFGGLAGVLWVHLTGIISPEDIILTTSVDALLMVVLGGPGTLIGGAIGAAVVVFIREYLSTQITWWQYVLGGVYIVTILYLPDGLMGIPAWLRQRRLARGQADAAAAPSTLSRS
jgi:branched-chain amino acid transport system permease protein